MTEPTWAAPWCGMGSAPAPGHRAQGEGGVAQVLVRKAVILICRAALTCPGGDSHTPSALSLFCLALPASLFPRLKERVPTDLKEAGSQWGL